jgi:hypothetical protein|tara:strand:+ start:29 stop:181 length:153 start_codon:yes stop_codon:yes gene_type:complete
MDATKREVPSELLEGATVLHEQASDFLNAVELAFKKQRDSSLMRTSLLRS